MRKVKIIIIIIGQTFLTIVALAGSAVKVPEFIKTIVPEFIKTLISFFPPWIWIILLILSLLSSSFYFLRNRLWMKNIIFGKDGRIRIAILLPLNHNDDFVREDAELQLQGFGKSLTEIRDKIEKYDLKFIDHQSDSNIAKREIINELKRGTKYFVCTMSSVCIDISKEFSELEKKFGSGGAILVCTVAGADEILTKKNSVYRFYINLKDEISTLLSNIDPNQKKAGIISFDSPYANSCAEHFKTEWNKRNDIEHIIEDHIIKLKVKRKNEIKNTLLIYENVLACRDVIFIVAYGEAYIEILKTLVNINKDALIVMTSTFSFKFWEDDINLILQDFNWLYCKPVLKNSEEFKNDVDVVTYFSMHALEKIVQVIKKTNNDISDFDEVWNKDKTPNKLCYSLIAGREGDCKIELTKKVK